MKHNKNETERPDTEKFEITPGKNKHHKKKKHPVKIIEIYR